MKKVLLAGLFAAPFAVNAQTTLTTAVDFTATDIHGDTHHLFEYLDAGKHVVIDFFFTTCGPCIESVPHINAVYEQYGCNTGEVIFLSIDQGDTKAEVEAYETNYGGLLPTISGEEGGTAINADYNIGAYPTVILIAPDRSIIEQDIYPIGVDGAAIASALNSAGVSEKVCSTTGIADKGLVTTTMELTSLFPNPASSYLSVAFSAKKQTSVSFEVVDMMGKVVSVVDAQAFSVGAHEMRVSTSDLSNGNYLLVGKADGDVVARTRFTVAK